MKIFSLFLILLASVFPLLILSWVPTPLLFEYSNLLITYISKIVFEILFIHIFSIFFSLFLKRSQRTVCYLFGQFMPVSLNFTHFKRFVCFKFMFIQFAKHSIFIDLLKWFNYHYFIYFRFHFYMLEFYLTFSLFPNILEYFWKVQMQKVILAFYWYDHYHFQRICV